MKSLKLTLTYLAAGLTALSPVAMAAPQQASKQEVNDYLSYYVTGANKTFNDLYSKNHSLFDQRSRSLIETWLEKYGNKKAPQIKATTIRDDKGQERLQITMTVSGETVTIAESNDPGYIMVNGQKINMEQTRDITGLFNELEKNNPEYKQMAAQLDQTTVPMTVHDGGLSAEQFVRLKPEQKVQYLMLLRKQMEAVEKVINGSVQTSASMMSTDKVYAYENNGVVFKGSVWDLLGSAAAYAEPNVPPPVSELPKTGGMANGDKFYEYSFGASNAPDKTWNVSSSCIVAGNIGIVKLESKPKGHKICNPILTKDDYDTLYKKNTTIPADIYKNNTSCNLLKTANTMVACNPILYGFDGNKPHCVESTIKDFGKQATIECNKKSPLEENCLIPMVSAETKNKCATQFKKILQSYYENKNPSEKDAINNCFGAIGPNKDRIKASCKSYFQGQIDEFKKLMATADNICKHKDLTKFGGQEEACEAINKRTLALETYVDYVAPTPQLSKPPENNTSKPNKLASTKFCDNSSTGIKSFLCSSKFWTGVGVGIGASVLACKTHLFGLCRKKTVTNTLTNTIYVPTPIVVPPPATEGGSGTGSGTSGGVRTDGSN